MSTRIRLVIAGAAVVTGCLLGLGLSGQYGCRLLSGSAPCTHILFVGNSYTSVNDLPGVFSKLARSGGHRVETGSATANGATLADHVASSATAAALGAKKWDIVVLQEQSQVPAIEQFRQTQMFPAARTLVAMARQKSAQPMFFLTWAHRDGWPENGLVNYSSMQAAIDDAYLAIAREQGAALAPVGYAWQTLLGQEAGAGLWQDDGSHPTEKGTYLAACVFYAAIFHESPTVLGDPSKWALP